MHNKSLILQLIGLLIFGFSLLAARQLQLPVETWVWEEFRQLDGMIKTIPILLLISLGTVLLRLDLIWRFLLNIKKFRFQWATLAVYGWPFLFLVVTILFAKLRHTSDIFGLLLFALPNYFGRCLYTITAILLGLGFLFAIEKHKERV